MIKKNLEEYKGTAIYAQQVDGKLSNIAQIGRASCRERV